MATLYVRDVPDRLYKQLRAQAEAAGRSVNAEALKLLAESVGHRPRKSVSAELRRLALEIDLPANAPQAEDVVRQGREDRTGELERRARRP